jgi:hypothetical protein
MTGGGIDFSDGSPFGGCALPFMSCARALTHMTEQRTICGTCRDEGRILAMWDRPGGPPGNGYVGCPDCEAGRKYTEAMQAEFSDSQMTAWRTRRRTQDRFYDALGDAWKWTRRGWRRVRPLRSGQEIWEKAARIAADRAGKR